MMKKTVTKTYLLPLMFMCSVLALIGCDTGTKIDAKQGLNKHIELIMPADINAMAVKKIDDGLAVLYGEKGKLVYKQGDNKEVVLEGVKAKKNGVWLHENNKNIYALWWSKTKNGKTLQIKSKNRDIGSTFSKDAGVYIAKNGILPDIKIADDGNDKIAVAYISEREPGYQLYFNRSLDVGKTWFESDRRINDLYSDKGVVTGNDPMLKEAGGSHVAEFYFTYIAGKLIAVWQEISVIEKIKYLRVLSKSSIDDGESWSDEVEIYKSDAQQTQEMHISQFKDELFVSVFIPKQGVLTFLSKGKSSKWSSLGVLPQTKDLVFASFMRTASINEKVFLSFTTRETNRKDQLAMYVKEKGLKKWVDISGQVFDKKDYPKDTPKDMQTKKVSSVLSTLGENGLLVAWEDYRNFVPVIHLNYSLDSGETWLKETISIARGGRDIAKFPDFKKDEKELWMLFTLSDSSNLRKTQGLYASKLASFSIDNTVTLHLPKNKTITKLSEKEKIKLLKKRAKEFWASRVKGEYKKIYDYYDPMYRSTWTKESFAASQGKVQFLEAETKDIKLTGNIATVKTKMKFSLALFEKAGILNDASPPQEREIDSKWGWFYDNWYLMPVTLFSKNFDY